MLVVWYLLKTNVSTIVCRSTRQAQDERRKRAEPMTCTRTRRPWNHCCCLVVIEKSNTVDIEKRLTERTDIASPRYRRSHTIPKSRAKQLQNLVRSKRVGQELLLIVDPAFIAEIDIFPGLDYIFAFGRVRIHPFDALPGSLLLFPVEYARREKFAPSRPTSFCKIRRTATAARTKKIARAQSQRQSP